ncbi:MAG: acyltransferase [Candidatus Thorarchaeota archaeon]
MKPRTMAYSAYMILSMLASLTLASLPSLFIFFWFLQNLDPIVMGFGFPFVDLHGFFEGIFGPMLPAIVFQKFWFVMLFVPIAFLCYGFFLGFLIAFFKLSRRALPFYEDGYYPMESEDWLIYEYGQIYYVILPWFAWFFTVFFDTKPRHTLFGAKIGKHTIVGNGRLFNPERTIIGDNCFFGYDAILSGHVYEGDRLYLKTVKLGNRVTIGANAVVLPGADIGDDVIVGANTVVPKDKVIPPNTIWVHGKAIPRRPKEQALKLHQVVGGPSSPFPQMNNGAKADTPKNGQRLSHTK